MTNMDLSVFLFHHQLILHILFEMSDLSPQRLRRGNMWCDRQPGSQPSISANEHDLFAGLGAVGGGRRMILTGLFAFLQRFSLESVQGGK